MFSHPFERKLSASITDRRDRAAMLVDTDRDRRAAFLSMAVIEDEAYLHWFWATEKEQS